jgi:serine/threonine-protein kinase
MVDMLGGMSESALSEGSLIAGRYRLEHPLGEGGMGTVWAATHTVTRRSVAMKFLKDSMRHRKDLRERFLREAAAASALKHPNVVEIRCGQPRKRRSNVHMACLERMAKQAVLAQTAAVAVHAQLEDEVRR